MSITKRISRNVFWLVLSEVSARIIIFLCTIYLARVLGQAGFGLFSLSLAVATYFWMFANMGITEYGTREISKNKEKTTELYSALNSLRFVLAISAFLIFGGILCFVSIPWERKIILLGGAFYAVACSFATDWVFRGLERMQYIMIGRITTSLFFLGGIYLLVKSPSDAFLAPIIYSFSFLVGSFMFLYLLNQKCKIPVSFRISFAEWWFHIKESIYFALNGFYYNIAIFIPFFFMGFWSTNEELGVFSVSHKLTILGINTVVLLIMAVYPTMSDFYVTDKANFKKVHTMLHKLIIAITAPICITVTLLSKDIILFFFGDLYIESIGILNILIWLMFFRVVRTSLSNALLSAGFQKLNLYAAGAGAAVVAFVGLILVPKYNGYGAAWALISGEVISMVLMNMYFSKKIYNLVFFRSYFVKVFFASVVMGLLIIYLPMSRFYGVFIGIVSYCVLSLSIGTVNKKTIRQVYHNIVG